MEERWSKVGLGTGVRSNGKEGRGKKKWGNEGKKER